MGSWLVCLRAFDRWRCAEDKADVIVGWLLLWVWVFVGRIVEGEFRRDALEVLLGGDMECRRGLMEKCGRPLVCRRFRVACWKE